MPRPPTATIPIASRANGIDWEVVDPHDPWSYIGYWGDHQIIYLLKLLEILDRHDPATLRGFLTRDIFAYANVPYRIKPYDALLGEPEGHRRFRSDRLKRSSGNGSEPWARMASWFGTSADRCAWSI